MPRAALGTGWGLLLPRRSAVASWHARRRRPRLPGLRLLVLGSLLAACGQSCASLSDGKCPRRVRFWTNRAATPLLRNTSTPKRAPVAYIVTPEGPLPITDESKRRSHCRRKRLPELFHLGRSRQKAQCYAALKDDGGSGGDGTSPPAFSLNLFPQRRPNVNEHGASCSLLRFHAAGLIRAGGFEIGGRDPHRCRRRGSWPVLLRDKAGAGQAEDKARVIGSAAIYRSIKCTCAVGDERPDWLLEQPVNWEGE